MNTIVVHYNKTAQTHYEDADYEITPIGTLNILLRDTNGVSLKSVAHFANGEWQRVVVVFAPPVEKL